MSLASTRIAVRLLAVAALAALTAGCFQPMYAEHADGSTGLREKLMGVELPPIDKPNASRDARLGVEPDEQPGCIDAQFSLPWEPLTSGEELAAVPQHAKPRRHTRKGRGGPGSSGRA